MKDIRLAIKSVLVSDAAVLALSAGRIFPVRMPQGTSDPSVVYTKISEVDDYSMSGDSGLDVSRYQIDCWSLSLQTTNELSNACHDALSGFRGVVEYGVNSPRDAIEIGGIFLAVGRESYESETSLYRMSRDYFVWYRSR